MTRRGDTTEHLVTEEKMTFLGTSAGTNDEYARNEPRVKHRGFVAAPHTHPLIEETFDVESGVSTLMVGTAKSGGLGPVRRPPCWRARPTPSGTGARRR